MAPFGGHEKSLALNGVAEYGTGPRQTGRQHRPDPCWGELAAVDGGLGKFECLARSADVNALQAHAFEDVRAQSPVTGSVCGA